LNERTSSVSTVHRVKAFDATRTRTWNAIEVNSWQARSRTDEPSTDACTAAAAAGASRDAPPLVRRTRFPKRDAAEAQRGANGF